MSEVSRPISDAVMRKFNDFMRTRHLRRTAEREAVLRAAMSLGKLFTAEQVLERLAEGDLPLSRATVYNGLSTLEQAGILRRLVFDGLPLHYEPASVVAQAHLVCSRCGRVKAVRDHILRLCSIRGDMPHST